MCWIFIFLAFFHEYLSFCRRKWRKIMKQGNCYAQATHRRLRLVFSDRSIDFSNFCQPQPNKVGNLLPTLFKGSLQAVIWGYILVCPDCLFMNSLRWFNWKVKSCHWAPNKLADHYFQDWKTWSWRLNQAPHGKSRQEVLRLPWKTFGCSNLI